MYWATRCRWWAVFSSLLTAALFNVCLDTEQMIHVKLLSGLLVTQLTLSFAVALHISLVPCSETHTLCSLLICYVYNQIDAIWVPYFFMRKMTKAWKNPIPAQEALLRQLIARDSGTVYGKDHCLAKIRSMEDLRRNHPLTDYEHYRGYAQRLADGEPNVFVGESLLRFGITSGTTGAGKLIPAVKSRRDPLNSNVFLWRCAAGKVFGSPSPVQRYCVLYCKPPTRFTKTGLRITSAMYVSFKRDKRFLNTHNTPPAGFEIESDFEATYVHLLFGIIDKHVGIFHAVFTSQVYKAIHVIKENWERLVDDIRVGQVSKDLKIPDWIRHALDAAMTSNPTRAEELRAEFSKGFEGIFARIWPYLRFINSVDIGGFLKKLERSGETRGTPIFSPDYGATESEFAINLHPKKIQYVLMLDEVIWEFIPENQSDEKQPDTLFIDEVERGKRYEVAFTAKAGFYRYRFGDVVEVVDFHEKCPVVQVKYRTGELLNLRSEKIDSNVVRTAIEQTVADWPGKKLTHWTCAESPLMHDSLEGKRYEMFYLLFVEFDNLCDNVLTSEQKSMFDVHLRQLNALYDQYRANEAIARSRVIVVQTGSFQKLQRLIMANSTSSVNQFKMPKKLRTAESLELMLASSVE